ncbi:beta-1,4-endoglucanase 1 [Syncephalis pseudoplumigaleata]|uniref:Endoglucanase n=1 Tax=Syncephalis pseudoplumigaleata TaxID=1712513 RepID=A0A4P9Z0C4_9FUNG|nr:beta-1,4-endoglucanase 1 [Syncephalis pseudoplumigaleata]|eukprot:RKP25141.1 beta-1,4-endoglucanase 1 [Syncephalis pseudoplumigaleata]
MQQHQLQLQDDTEVINLPNSTDKYARHLGLAILFYESQRSGKLPVSQRILWRKPAHLSDGWQIGRNLSGGYYDAGDFIKFGLPAAYTASLLGWAAVDYAAGLRSANEWSNNLAAIRWATDYFIACHVKPNEFVVQVGDPKVDHQYWGSPEDMPPSMARPVYVASPKYPGSEPAAETAAAMAAASIAFAASDPRYSATLVRHAEQLYRLARQHVGLYQKGIARQARHGMQGVKDCYESSGYDDELAWAALWLYRATKKPGYLRESEAHFARALRKSGDLSGSFLSWDDKAPAVAMLLARHTGKRRYLQLAQRYTQWAERVAPRTPGGLIWVKGGSEWGSTSVAMSTAFLCAYYDDYRPFVMHLSRSPSLEKFVKQQIDYVIGENPARRSYIVGADRSSPQRAHHAAAQGVPKGEGWRNYTSMTPNRHVLYGALVGGPDRHDMFIDRRDDYRHNEPALDYNAPLVLLLARMNAVKHRRSSHRLA